MDVLSDVLQAVRLKGAVFFDVHATEPLVATTPPTSEIAEIVMPDAEHVIPFHIMLRGGCWIESIGADDPPARFQEGDIVYYPHGHSHVLATNLGDREPVNLDRYREAAGEARPMLLHHTNGGEPTVRFVCGYLSCRSAPFNPLLEALPAQVLARQPRQGNTIEVELIQAAIEESGAQRPGRDSMLARLSELLFVGALRRTLEQMPDSSRGWFAALRDPQIGRALQALHASPARDWTLEGLAREAGMSRAVFAERFAEAVGETSMRYLARWRMQLAARMLEEPGRSVESVAEAVGYRSEAAFNRAFKNIVGTPPGKWRRGRRGAGPHPPKPAA